LADKIKYSQKAIDTALDEIGDLVTRLSERDKEVTSLIAGIATRVEKLEKLVETLVSSGDKP
jgi:hypothetical protein